MSKEWRADSVFDVLGSEVARQILLAARDRPVSARELAERCDVSAPTVYRRLDALLEYDMVAEHDAIDADGHHRRRFETVLSEVRLRLGDGGFAVDVEVDDEGRSDADYADSLSGLWADLEREAAGDDRGGAEERDGPAGSSDAG